MPTWNEHLNDINERRNERNEKDERLYITQTELLKAESSLNRARIQETDITADRKQIDTLRSAISVLEAGLQKLNREVDVLDDFRSRLLENESRIIFLQKKITAIEGQINELTQKLQEENNKPEPDPQKISELENQIAALQQLKLSVHEDLDLAEQQHTVLKQQQEQVDVKQQQLEEEKATVREKINELEKELAVILHSGGQKLDELEEKRNKLRDKYQQDKNALIDLRDKLHDSITGIYVDPHPRKLISNLDDTIPFLLIPVRIETRFITTNQVAELWLRIYPDDFAIHTHEKVLTDREVAAGEKYWKALLAAEKTGGAQKENQKKAAWSSMASVFNPQRSAWVASQTKPTNWDDLPTINDAADLIFPVHDHTKTHSWSRAPRTQVMPDKFVVMLYEGSTIVREEVGRIIPDELIVGPAPLEPDESFVRKDDKLVFGEDFDWTSDFDKAIQLGMGFKIPLTASQVIKGFDKIQVLGVFLSADEIQSQRTIEELIDNHHYSPKGFSIVRQGSPTNNTEADGSGYTKNDSFNNISYYVEAADHLCIPANGCDCDGKNLADALGTDYKPFQSVLNSEATDLAEAIAMNTALYPGTLGYYFDTMLQPALSENSQDTLRDFFISHVTGRGPLPSIRVGNQPYGILLTSDFSNWKWQKQEPFFDTPFLTTLYNVLNHYQLIWNSLLSQLLYVGKPGQNSSDVLMNVLGLQAGSVSFYQRVGYSTDYLKNLDEFQFGGRYYSEMQKNFRSKTDILDFLKAFGFVDTDPRGMLNIPQLARLVFQHYATPLDAANTIDNLPLSEKDKISYYDEVAKKNYIHWLEGINNTTTLERQDFGAGKKAPTSILYMQLRRALSLQLHKSTITWFGKHNIPITQTSRAVNFHNIRPSGDVSKWEVMRAKVEVAVPEHDQKNLFVSEYLLTIGRDEEEAAFMNKIKSSLHFLAGLPTARLERCFVEHLDACTYRLDAWQTALFDLRLRKQRGLTRDIRTDCHVEDEGTITGGTAADPGNDPERKKGLYIGAYGWVENVRPIARQQVATDTVAEKLRPKNNAPLFEYADNGGFVHAPSLNQASAAAILRCGYMTHATPAEPEVMSVNISSERVRRALFILQGVRNGQTLEALLGYQFERGLHDRASANNALIKLNLYIYNFREAFPILQHQINQAGTGEATETIPPNNVVNGITLGETSLGFPYGATGEVLSASADERLAIEEERNKLRDSLDAVKDLLTSESVYQLVQGNFDRSGAVINSLKDAKIAPEIDVINTPRSSQFSFTNRVTIHFENLDGNDAAGNPWHPVPMTPRAKLETGVNKWLGKILGSADALVCRVSHTDNSGIELNHEDVTIDKLNIQPIDLVYITGNELNTGAGQQDNESRTSVSELETRIAYYYRQAQTLDEEQPIRIEFLKPENLAGKKPLGTLLPLLRMLKAMITDARPLHAEDFDPPSKESISDKNNPRGYDTANLLARIQNIHLSFQTQLNYLYNLPIQASIEDADGTVTIYSNLKDIFDALLTAKLGFADISFVFGDTEAADLQNILIRVSNIGTPNAFPIVASALNDANKLLLLEHAAGLAITMAAADKKAVDLLTEAAVITDIAKKTDTIILAGKQLTGDVFNILPLFAFNNESDIQLSHNDRTQLLNYAVSHSNMVFVADEWLQNMAHVRPKLARWEYIRMLYEALHHDNLELKPVQLPYRANDSWLAVEFPEKDGSDATKPFNITHDTLSVTIHGDWAFKPAAKQSGLLIDDWTEVIPGKEEVTGIAFNYNQPNAVPPQALLLAVTPEETGHWNWDTLVGILNDTLHRAKLRAVEPQMLDKIDKVETGVLLPALLANFTQYDLDVSLDYRLNLLYIANIAPIFYVGQVIG